MTRNFLKLFVVFALFATFFSCNKDNNPIEKPVMVVTLATSRTPAAGDPVTFSIDCRAVNTLTKLKVVENYGGKTRVVLDSSINTKGFMHAYIYDVPDIALSGQKIVLTFSLTDEKGNTTTDTEELTVSASRPQIQVSADKTQASASEQVTFTVNATSSAGNLSLFEVEESVNGGLGNVIKTENLPDNTSTYQTTYTYTVPANMQVGQYVVLIFKVHNKEGQGNFVSKKITVK